MKKFISSFLVLTILFLFSGCSNTSTETNDNGVEKEIPTAQNNHTDESSTEQTTLPETNTTTEPVVQLSSQCGYLLCTGYDGENYYELVANRIDAYPESTFEFGVIKNNTWLIPLSTDCPFIDENGLWKGTRGSNTPGIFEYMGNGYFYYNHDNYSWSEIIYNPETNVSFEVSGLVGFSLYKTDMGYIDYTKLINENGEVLTRLNDSQLTFSYLNLNTGKSRPIPLKLTNVNNNLYIGLLSDGLFYAHSSSNFTGVDYDGFYDLSGNQVIDLTQYKYTDLGDYMFHNEELTIRCMNDSDVAFDITFDTSGNIIRQEKAE